MALATSRTIPARMHSINVVAVLDALAIGRAHFWGYSMGAWIGFGMAQFAPERVDRLVIGAQIPYARNLEGTRQMMRTGIAEGNDALIAAMEKRYGFEATPDTKESMRDADLQALLAAAQDRPSLEQILPGMRMPCLLYAGEADPLCPEAKAASQLIANAVLLLAPRSEPRRRLRAQRSRPPEGRIVFARRLERR